jgi:hypothetical protein
VPSPKPSAFTALVTLAAILPSTLTAQEVKLPAEIKAGPGEWVIVAPESVDGGAPKWRIDSGLQEVRLDLLLPPAVISQLKGKVFRANTGRYKVEAWNAKGDVASDIAVCWVIIGDPAPLPPGPTPPGPNPPDPQPPGPTLPLTGMRVLILEETAHRPRLSRAQQVALTSPAVRSYLSSKCPNGIDGQTPEWRLLDVDQSLANESPAWQQLRSASKAPRPLPDHKPWVVIAGSSGVAFDGPYPATEAEAVALFTKYGGR